MLTLKRIFIVLSLLLFVVVNTGFGQEETEDQTKSKKEQRKQDKDEMYAANLKAIQSLVADSSFVVEAYSLRGRNTVNYFVSPSTNFIKVDRDKVIIQTANSVGLGYNGLGGITIEGNIREYDIFNNDHGANVQIQFSSAVIGFSTLNISVNASGNANAYLRTAFGGYISFSGDFVGLSETSTYQGQSIL